jgi:WD40 repeat protein
MNHAKVLVLTGLVLSLGAIQRAHAQGVPDILWKGGGHTGVNSVAMSPDGRTIATASAYDETIKLWRSSDGVLIRTLAAHYAGIQSIAFSPDGQFLASGAEVAFGADEDHVKLWRVSDGAIVRTFSGALGTAFSVAFSPDGTLLAASKGFDIEIFRVSDAALLGTLTGHDWFVFSVAFSPNGQVLASGSGDNTVKLWRMSDGALLRTLTGHTFFVSSVAFSPDGQEVLSGSWDMTVKVWNPVTGAVLRTLQGHTEAITAVAYSRDGTRIASADNDEIRIWRASNGAFLRSLAPATTGYFSSLTFTSSSQMVLSGSFDGHARLWNVENMAPARGLQPHTHAALLETIGHHEAPVASAVFAPVGSTLASGSKDRTAKIWDAASGHDERTLRGPLDIVNSVAYSPDALVLAGATGSPPPDTMDTRIFLWDVLTGAVIRTMPGHSGGSTAVDISPDGTIVASGGRDSTVKLWQTSNGALLRTLSGQGGGITDVEFAPDGTTIASSSNSGTVFLRKVSDGALVRTITSPNGIVSFRYSSDGARLVTGESAYGDNVRIWDVATGGSIRVLPGHPDGFVQAVAFDRDDETIVSGSGYSRDIRFWRVSDGALLQLYDEETGWGLDPQFSVDYSPDGGATFVYGRNDSTVVVATNPF